MTLEAFALLLEKEPGWLPKYPGFIVGSEPSPRIEPKQSVPTYDQRLLLCGAMDAVRLYQLANNIAAQDKQLALLSQANGMFSDCGADQLPTAELYQLMLQHWPPPPPGFAVRMIEQLQLLYAVDALAAAPNSPPSPYKIAIEGLLMKLLMTPTGKGIGSGGPN